MNLLKKKNSKKSGKKFQKNPVKKYPKNKVVIIKNRHQE